MELTLHSDIVIFKKMMRDTEAVLDEWSNQTNGFTETIKQIDLIKQCLGPNFPLQSNDFDNIMKSLETNISSRLNLLLDIDEKIDFALKFIPKLTTDILDELQIIEDRKDALSKSMYHFIQKSALIRQIKRYEKILLKSTNGYIRFDIFNKEIEDNYKCILVCYENLQYLSETYNSTNQAANQTNNNNSTDSDNEKKPKTSLVKVSSFKISSLRGNRRSSKKVLPNEQSKRPRKQNKPKVYGAIDNLERKELSDNMLSLKKIQDEKVIVWKYFMPEKDSDDELESLERDGELDPLLFDGNLLELDIEELTQDHQFHVPDDSLDNIRLWPTYVYRLYSVSSRRIQIACILRALPGCIHSKDRVIVSFVEPMRPLPPIDLSENIISRVIDIQPSTSGEALNFNFNPGWRIIIPIHLSKKIKKDFKILKLVKNENQPSVLSVVTENSKLSIRGSSLNTKSSISTRKSKRSSSFAPISSIMRHIWIELPCTDVQIERSKQQQLRMVETKIEPGKNPFGVYLVVTKTREEKGKINKLGASFVSGVDSHIFITIPRGAIRINMDIFWKVTAVDLDFWNEVKCKYEKAMDKMIHFSHFVELDCHRKKLLKPATINVFLPRPIEPKEEEVVIQCKLSDSENSENFDHVKENTKNNKVRVGLDSFQTIMLNNKVIKMSSNEKIVMINYNDEEEKWQEFDNYEIEKDKAGENMSVEIKFLQPLRFFLVRSKRNATPEELSKAASLVHKEFAIRNCLIVLFKSTCTHTHYQIVICLKSQFEKILSHYQENYFTLEPFNNPLPIELTERQCLRIVLTGNIKHRHNDSRVYHLAFQTVYKNQIDFYLKEIDQSAQRLLDHYRGYLEVYMNKLVKKTLEFDKVSRKVNSNEDQVKLCSFLLKIPRKLKKTVKPYKNTMLNEKLTENALILLSFVIERLGSQWPELALALKLPKARVDIICQQYPSSEQHKMAAQMLIFWIKGKLLMDNKLIEIRDALEDIGREDIVVELNEHFIDIEGYDVE